MRVKSESEVTQSCLTPSDPMDCSPPSSSVHGIFQARVLEWGAFAFSGGYLLLSCCCLCGGRAGSVCWLFACLAPDSFPAIPLLCDPPNYLPGSLTNWIMVMFSQWESWVRDRNRIEERSQDILPPSLLPWCLRQWVLCLLGSSPARHFLTWLQLSPSDLAPGVTSFFLWPLTLEGGASFPIDSLWLPRHLPFDLCDPPKPW